MKLDVKTVVKVLRMQVSARQKGGDRETKELKIKIKNENKIAVLVV
jgi:hypothetical protein